MKCPDCGNEAKPGAAFCGRCGARLPASQPAAVPTEPMPAVPVAPEPVPSAAPAPAPAAPPAASPVAPAPAAAAPPVGFAPPPPGAVPPGAPQAAYAPAPGVSPKKSKGGVIVVIVLLMLFACLACGLAGWFGYRYLSPAPTTTTTTTTTATAGFATSDEALTDTMKQRGISDWVYKLDQQTADSAEYVVGPPQSEFSDRLVFVRDTSGNWSFKEANPLVPGEAGTDPGGYTQGDALQAASDVVDQFLTLVQSNQGLEAQKLTTEPFRSDSASAEMGRGYLLSWEISGVPVELGDGTIQVKVVEKRRGGDARLIYLVVPTDAGPRITTAEPW